MRHDLCVNFVHTQCSRLVIIPQITSIFSLLVHLGLVFPVLLVLHIPGTIVMRPMLLNYIPWPNLWFLLSRRMQQLTREPNMSTIWLV